MTPIRATPDVTGADADAIRKEIEEGTPNTPERVETMRRADEVYRRYSDARVRLAFMGMELTVDEAVNLLREGFVLAATVGGIGPGTANLEVARERARALQLRVMEMHIEPSRRHIKCATCGQTRMDTKVSPEGVPGYVVEAEPQAISVPQLSERRDTDSPINNSNQE